VCSSDLAFGGALGDGFQMTKQEQTKVAISALHNKMVLLDNNACAPFIYGLTRKDYIIK
jgi:hypothetical protein